MHTFSSRNFKIKVNYIDDSVRAQFKVSFIFTSIAHLHFKNMTWHSLFTMIYSLLVQLTKKCCLTWQESPFMAAAASPCKPWHNWIKVWEPDDNKPQNCTNPLIYDYYTKVNGRIFNILCYNKIGVKLQVFNRLLLLKYFLLYFQLDNTTQISTLHCIFW